MAYLKQRQYNWDIETSQDKWLSNHNPDSNAKSDNVN